MKKVLITGCSGLVGTYAIKKFLDEGYFVFGVDMKDPIISTKIPKFKFYNADLTETKNLTDILNECDPDVVVNAFGIKGSPIRAKENPVDFLYPSFKINTEIINQCYKRNIWLVFMSSVGVYAPAEKFVEDTVWKTLPSEADWFPSWSKRTGELLLEAYKVQYGYDKWSIIRPANIFGEYDDFSGQGTVISSSIKKVYEATDKIDCWGDGSPIRDFVFGGDVANAVFKMYDNKINDVVNFGAGEEITIKGMIDNLIEISGKQIEVTWDTTKPNGDLRRQMDVTKQTELGLLPKTKFKDALAKTYHYYTTQFPIEGVPFIVRDLLTNGYVTGKTENIIVDTAQFHYHIDNLIEKSIDKENYSYRFEYHNTDDPTHDYKHSIQKEEIESRDNFIKENGYDVIQRWGEFSMGSKYYEEQQYLRGIVEKIVPKIYPELQNNISHYDNFTLYENGDFITPHTDGLNPRRYCVVLIYLSHKENYNDGGGRLVLGSGNDIDGYVEPTNDNYTIIDFTKSETLHAVEEVKNNFKRYTYINFVYNKKLQDVWEKNQNLI